MELPGRQCFAIMFSLLQVAGVLVETPHTRAEGDLHVLVQPRPVEVALERLLRRVDSQVRHGMRGLDKVPAVGGRHYDPLALVDQ